MRIDYLTILGAGRAAGVPDRGGAGADVAGGPAQGRQAGTLFDHYLTVFDHFLTIPSPIFGHYLTNFDHYLIF